MKTNEEWLAERMDEFNNSPEDALIDHILRLQSTIKQFLDGSPQSKVTRGGLEAAHGASVLFMQEIENTQNP